MRIQMLKLIQHLVKVNLRMIIRQETEKTLWHYGNKCPV